MRDKFLFISFSALFGAVNVNCRDCAMGKNANELRELFDEEIMHFIPQKQIQNVNDYIR